MLTYDLELHDDVAFEPLVKLPPYAIFARDHPLAKRDSVTLRELAEEPLVLLDLPHSRDYFHGLFAAKGLQARVAQRSTQPEVLRTLVANSFGYGIVNARPRIDRALDGGGLRTGANRGHAAADGARHGEPRRCARLPRGRGLPRALPPGDHVHLRPRSADGRRVRAEPGAEEILGRLVSFPTVAGESNLDLVAWVAGVLDDAGAVVTEVAGARPDARNLHAVLGPADVPGVLLSAHSDVVGTDGQEWSTDPFALTRTDERLYGRGTADMKGFVAAALAAMRAAPAGELRRPLHFALSSDEELGCAGVGPLLDVLERLPARPAYAIVGEPTQLRVVVAHKGKAAWRAHVRGRACHSALAPQGVNAVAYAARLIVALEAIGRELAGAGADDSFSVPHATLSVGPDRRGARAQRGARRLHVRLRAAHAAGTRVDGFAPRVAAAAASSQERDAGPGAGDRDRPRADRGLSRARARRLVRRARELAALVDTAAGGTVDFGSEAGLFQRRLDIPVVVCGPGSMAQGHGPDEFIEREQLRAGEAMVERLLGSLACIDPTDAARR